MRRIKLNIDKLHRANLAKLAALSILLVGCFPLRSMAQQPGSKNFFIGGGGEQRPGRGSAE